MRFSALDRKMLRDLWLLKGQLFAIALVIACGISTFVAMHSTLDSLRRAMRDYYSAYRFADVFAALKRAPESVANRLARVPGVGGIETRVVADVTLDVAGTVEAVTGRLVSLPDIGEPRLNAVFLRVGRMPEVGRDDEVLVSESFAEAHGLEPSDTVTAIINERRKDLRIVGVALSPEYVYSMKPGGMVPDDRLFGVLWMRREALGTALDMDGAFNDLALSMTRDGRPAQVLAAIDSALERFGGLGAYERKDQLSNWFLHSEIEQLQSTGLVMPLVFLGVAAFLLSVVLARVVGQQREQIAVLKAFGYTTGQVGVHYAKLIVLVVVFAGILGIAGGAWMGRGMTGVYAQFYRFPELSYEFAPRYFVQAFLIGLAAALLGAARAIREAVTLPPAEAMRPKAPPRYRQTLLERLGLGRWLGTTGRIVLRSLVRRPGRSLLSMLGIGSGAALLVVGNSFMDALDYGIDLQFNNAQREDMTVRLVEPRSSRALHELRRYPGVRLAEPTRTVAARFRAGHRSRRTSVDGIAPGSTLQRLIGEDLRPVRIPPDGVVLTQKLAEILGVRTGEDVVIEVLEGTRPSIRVPVARVVEAFIGMGAYMDIRALNRYLGEGATISGANLLVDSAQLSRLHARLKETPAVAGVGLREETIESFERTAAESMRIMSFFMFLFATIIACGVVYNYARLTLSEHARELASMRVLGYRRGEISTILLGELWLLTLCAIPVGLAIGAALSAWVSTLLDTELYRIPFVIYPKTFGIAGATVVGAAVVSGLLVRRRLDRLDLVEVLKVRE